METRGGLGMGRGHWRLDGSLAATWLSHGGESRAGWADRRTRSGCDKGQISDISNVSYLRRPATSPKTETLPWGERTQPTQKGDPST